MHLLLTDRLTCPRCGPEFGLILLADRLEDRRVLEGALGCPNCRDRYPVCEGFGDLRPPPRAAFPDGETLAAPDSPTLMEVAGLLGITEGGGHVVLLGRMASHAGALAEKLQSAEVVGISSGLRSLDEVEGVSRLSAGSRLPFRDQSLRGAALFGGEGVFEPGEVARVVARLGRVVVWGGVEGWDSALEGAGMTVLVSETTAVVAVRK